ncbi:MAG: sodium-independent anion transporter [Leptothrix sp. (in: Bacteria)]|nr:sodium-independent anion transporter [Leptothrix sp. (in: b-proteobacteria)]
MRLSAHANSWLPMRAWWPQVTRQTLRGDATAALTGAVIVLPQAVAFATIAGLPPQYGLYAAMVPTIVAALWGSSFHLVSGPTTAISVLVFATLSPLAEPGSERYIGMVLTLALLAGVFQLAMGLARLGALVNFISHTVIVGFTAGAALLIVASQIKNFFGLAVPRGAEFHETLLYAAEHLGEAHVWVLAVGAVTLASGLLARRVLPRWPYMIVAMVAGAITAAVLNLALGAERTGITTIGALPGALPVPSLPDLSYATLKSLLFPAAVVAVIALTEAVAIARSVAAKSGQRLDADQEFIGQGLSNIAGSFFSAYPSSGSFNRSGINHAAGASTPLAAALSAPILLAIALLAAPLAAYLPVAALAGILFIVAWGLIDWHHIGQILRHHPHERIVLLVTWVGVLIDLERGLFFGIVVSLLFYLYRTSQPSVEERAPPTAARGDVRRKMVAASETDPPCPQLAMLRVRGSIYFGAVEHVREALHRVDETDARRKWVLLMAQGINFVDLAGAQLLADEAQRRRALGGALFVVGAQPAVRQMLERSEHIAAIGAERLIAHKGDALRAAYPLLDSAECRACSKRVFEECHVVLPDGTPRPENPPESSSAANRSESP